MRVRFVLNGRPAEAEIQDGTTLLDLLRDTMHVHSVKRGCENAECGACTVLVDGLAVNSCIYLAAPGGRKAGDYSGGSRDAG